MQNSAPGMLSFRLPAEEIAGFVAMAREKGYTGSELARLLVRRAVRGDIDVAPREADDYAISRRRDNG